jgi:hypothetical protein
MYCRSPAGAFTGLRGFSVDYPFQRVWLTIILSCRAGKAMAARATVTEPIGVRACVACGLAAAFYLSSFW